MREKNNETLGETSDMILDAPSASEQEQQLFQHCNALGVGHWVFAIQTILDRLRGLEEYIDDMQDCPLPAVGRLFEEAAHCDPRARDQWWVSRLARLRCFRFHASWERQRWDPTRESFRIFSSRGEVQVWEDVVPNPTRAALEVWLHRLHAATMR